MPSITGYVSAREWLDEANQSVEHAIECLAQITGIIIDVRTELADVPNGRGALAWNRRRATIEIHERLESVEDAVIRLTAALKTVDFAGINKHDVDCFESWRASAADAADRAGRR